MKRRTLLKTGAAAGLLTATNGLFTPVIAQNTPIKIGFINPQTGPLAAFSESDAFSIARFMKVTGELGLNIEVISKDSQSNANRAAEVAKELIVNDGIHMMLVATTPDTTNPVTTVCENEQIPVISTMAPWQPWFIGQQANPGDPGSWQPFEFAYHYMWGVDDLLKVFTNMWDQLDTNKKVGGLFSNDADGNAFGNPNIGFPPAITADGYDFFDSGRYEILTDDFSAQINAFKAQGSDIITGVAIPPDFTTFLNQSKQQGLNPKVITLAKAYQAPQAAMALGDSAHNLSMEAWWTPDHPFKSSLTGESARELATTFEQETGKPWTQAIGFIHSLFELTSDVMQRVDDPTDNEAVAEAIAATQVDTVVGPIAWDGAGLPTFVQKNVCKTPLVGAQWKVQDGKPELVIVDNQTAPEIPLGGKMEALE